MTKNTRHPHTANQSNFALLILLMNIIIFLFSLVHGIRIHSDVLLAAALASLQTANDLSNSIRENRQRIAHIEATLLNSMMYVLIAGFTLFFALTHQLHQRDEQLGVILALCLINYLCKITALSVAKRQRNQHLFSFLLWSTENVNVTFYWLAMMTAIVLFFTRHYWLDRALGEIYIAYFVVLGGYQCVDLCVLYRQIRQAEKSKS